MNNRISIREWQQKYTNGEFASPDLTTQHRAGWHERLDNPYYLAEKLKKLARIVMGIKDPFILDHYNVQFNVACHLTGVWNGEIYFDPLEVEQGDSRFSIMVDSPHEDKMYALYTERGGIYEPELSCKDRQVLITYLNAIGPQLAEQMELEDETPDLDDFEPGDDGQVPTAPEMGGMSL